MSRNWTRGTRSNTNEPVALIAGPSIHTHIMRMKKKKLYKPAALFAVAIVVSTFTISQFTIYKKPEKTLATELLPKYSEGELASKGWRFIREENTKEPVRKYLFELSGNRPVEIHFSLRDETKPSYAKTKYFNVAYKSGSPISPDEETFLLELIDNIESAEKHPLKYGSMLPATDLLKTWTARLALFLALCAALFLLASVSSIKRLFWETDTGDTFPATGSLFVASNPRFKVALTLIMVSAAAFVWCFFATPMDEYFSSRIFQRAALWATPLAAAGFALFFVFCVASLFQGSNIPRSVVLLLFLLIAVSLAAKILLPDKLPFRPVDELDMVMKGSGFWKQTVESFIPGHPVYYYPFRPNGHSILISIASIFGPVSFKSAICVNIAISALILIVVFLLCIVLFGRPWTALLCTFLLSINSIFNFFLCLCICID